MRENIDFTTICREHYLLGYAVGQLKFCGRWFHSRMPGNYPQMGTDSYPMGIQGPFPSLKSLTLDTFPETPHDLFIQEVKEEMDELFSRYTPGTHVSAERASAIMTFALGIEKRYLKSINRYHLPYMDAIEKAKGIIPTSSEDFKTAIDCLYLGYSKACVVMARRALEAILVTSHAEGNTLIEIIKDAEKKEIISKNDCEIAHATRMIANRGAHFQDDGLDQIDNIEAKSTIDVINKIILSIKI